MTSESGRRNAATRYRGIPASPAGPSSFALEPRHTIPPLRRYFAHCSAAIPGNRIISPGRARDMLIREQPRACGRSARSGIRRAVEIAELLTRKFPDKGKSSPFEGRGGRRTADDLSAPRRGGEGRGETEMTSLIETRGPGMARKRLDFRFGYAAAAARLRQADRGFPSRPARFYLARARAAPRRRHFSAVASRRVARPEAAELEERFRESNAPPSKDNATAGGGGERGEGREKESTSSTILAEGRIFIAELCGTSRRIRTPSAIKHVVSERKRTSGSRTGSMAMARAGTRATDSHCGEQGKIIKNSGTRPRNGGITE